MKDLLMTPELLSSVSGIILSLLFSYLPGLSTWYETLTATYKRLVMLALLALTSLSAFGFSCLGWLPYFNLNLACDQKGGVELLTAFVLALVANQSTYLITPKPGRGISAGNY
jgi:hypothetical protein